MQQRFENNSTDSPQTEGTQPLGAFPLAVTTTRQAAILQPARKRFVVTRVVFQFLLLGFLLACLYLALYPLLASARSAQDPLQQALYGALPWLPSLYWTNAWPELLALITQVSLLAPTSALGMANLSFVLLALAGSLTLLAARIGNSDLGGRASRMAGSVVLTAILLFTLLFGVVMLLSPIGPSAMTQDMLLYGLYGRLLAVYHGNPYVVSPATFPRDLLQTLVGTKETAHFGPVWLDLSVLVSLFAQDSLVRIILSFRSIGLLAHLANTLLIWSILGRQMPQTRAGTTLLYAWNPLMLLFGVSMMHQEIFLLTCILLAVFFFQRNMALLCWVFVLLAVLTNLLCLVLLPLFLRLSFRPLRMARWGRRFIWTLGMLAITVFVGVLAYAPYWIGWGSTGLFASLQSSYLQAAPLNSLHAAFFNIPVQYPPAIQWLLTPFHWAAVSLAIAGCLLLFGLWLADTLDLVLLFSSWLLLLLLALLPVYWPWYLLLPFGLALCSANRRAVLLAVLFALGGLGCYYCWLWQPVWLGQGLATIGLPLLLWGWSLFFSSTWQMARAREEELTSPRAKSRIRLSRPPWLSRPPRPGFR